MKERNTQVIKEKLKENGALKFWNDVEKRILEELRKIEK